MPTIIFSVVMGIISLLGLFIAARAHDTMFYFFGMVLFVFGVALIFGIVHRASAPKAKSH
ncbi:MAG: hypothetical protein U1E45_15745 [Geminicoccaceae bacterium]